MTIRRDAGRLPLVGTGRVGKLGKINPAGLVIARGSIVEASIVNEVELTASYLSIAISSTLSSAANHQYRTEPDPVNYPGEYATSAEAGVVSSSELTIINVPVATGLVLYARMWIDGVFDSGWYDTTIRFDTPGRGDPPIVTQYLRGE